MAINVPLHVVQGNDETWTFTAQDYNQNVINLTGYTLKVVVKPSQSSLDSAGTSYTPTLVAAALGTVSFKLPHTATATPGTQWYRFDVTDAGGNVTTSQFGILTIVAA